MNEGLIEVEIKVPIPRDDFKHIKETILKLGGKYLNSESQQDTYYDHPCKSFQETDEAVRVRSSISPLHEKSHTDHPPFELAYKGPKLDLKSKTRLELSITISDIASAKSMLEELDFQPIATIIKKRASYKVDLITICLDDVEDVGTFMELERIVSIEENLEPVREELFKLANTLGVQTHNSIRKSYLELYLEKKNQ